MQIRQATTFSTFEALSHKVLNNDEPPTDSDTRNSSPFPNSTHQISFLHRFLNKTYIYIFSFLIKLSAMSNYLRQRTSNKSRKSTAGQSDKTGIDKLKQTTFTALESTKMGTRVPYTTPKNGHWNLSTKTNM